MADFADPYIDPATGLLRNRIGATSQSVLNAAEADYGLARTVELVERPVKVTADLRHLQLIHQRLFQDVYDWAGQLRTVDIRKGSDATAEFFMPVSRLQTGAMFAFQELADDNYLRGLDREKFVDKLAHHYDQVNYLHPFREGNGRTQRIMWTQVAREAGYEMDWRNVTGAVNDRASRDAMEKQDLTGLRLMFTTIIQPVSEPATDKKVELQRTVDALRSRARDSTAPYLAAFKRAGITPPAASTTRRPTDANRHDRDDLSRRQAGTERE
ncbi:cell filamentation protein Fic (plasmid) [Cryobacterium sp. LW097]|uniref:Fic/DOC family protein n=1 Tax=unclassified Cryobacterium TaxID=2649013 RepID=UPI000B4D87CF|nr:MULTISPECIES: Fic family protein [unclassified Cryobacterium]ASD24168.1 cell filamentation protein Fic [Cryobacterium sp. LW097]ASD24289.1 cell filamentation protein Fic [Cryobacterium sp. LW097]TFC52860.1 cell filamentation protein Fic [Cryobacterium sp. TMB3-1-2]TFC62199.1 cell filamentation protein Fic [Cryobacterium sp. TMB1-7]TFC70710.1 cell filamentation protein Fic [Cryobacterium sp. TMB3-15]